jgi:tellurium resistance protein TerD
MALINCSECSKEISDKADVCPQCGCPVASPQKLPSEPMIFTYEGGVDISIQCPSCNKDSSIKKAKVTKTDTGYKVNGQGRCACGFVFTEIKGDKRLRCPHCGSMELSIQKEGFQAGPACCGAILAGPLGLLCGAKDSNKLNRHCLNCGHKWSVGQ